MNILLDIDPWTLISFALWKEIFFFFCLKKGNRKKWPLCSSLSQFLIYSKSFSIIFSSFFSKFHSSMELTNLCISIVFSAPYLVFVTIIYGKVRKKINGGDVKLCQRSYFFIFSFWCANEMGVHSMNQHIWAHNHKDHTAYIVTYLDDFFHSHSIPAFLPYCRSLS